MEVMTGETVRLAYLSALAAHRRAIVIHQHAASVHERWRQDARASIERAKATRERERLAAAESLHPEWIA
jgi:hypothetical protein